MYSDKSTLHVYDERRPLHVADSDGVSCKKISYKTSSRKRRKLTREEEAFLPKELIDRVITFAKAFGVTLITIAKVGKLAYRSKSIDEMAAYCCTHYFSNGKLRTGLIRYSKGKIYLYDKLYAGHQAWLEMFDATYLPVAEDVKYAVLSGRTDPVILAGLFLKF